MITSWLWSNTVRNSKAPNIPLCQPNTALNGIRQKCKLHENRRSSFLYPVSKEGVPLCRPSNLGGGTRAQGTYTAARSEKALLCNCLRPTTYRPPPLDPPPQERKIDRQTSSREWVSNPPSISSSARILDMYLHVHAHIIRSWLPVKNRKILNQVFKVTEPTISGPLCLVQNLARPLARPYVGCFWQSFASQRLLWTSTIPATLWLEQN